MTTLLDSAAGPQVSMALPAAQRRWLLLGCLPPVVCVLVAVGLWKLCYPGLFSYDSMAQYQQAVARQFNDAHPAIMAISLSLVMALGKGIQHLMLAQCIAGVWGVFYLAYEAVLFAFGRKLSKPWAAWIALLVLLVLLLPLSPLSFYLMTFWKDVWLMICLCWLGGISLNIFRVSAAGLSAALLARLAAYLLLVTLAVLTRHNAIVILPVCCLLFTLFLWPAVGRPYAVAAALVPLLFYGGVKHTVYRAFGVQRASATDFAQALELVCLCARCPQAEASLPYMRKYLVEDYRQKYVPGWVDLSVGCWKPGYFDNSAQIQHEYWQALRKFPLQMLAVKLVAFRFHLARNPCLRFQYENYPNNVGLGLNPRFAPWRDWLRGKVQRCFDHRVLQWFFTRHLTWLVLNLGCVLWLFRQSVLRKQKALFHAAVILLIPLVYYFSYCVMSPAGDFRYMYPATLSMQIGTLALLAGRGISRLKGPSGA